MGDEYIGLPAWLGGFSRVGILHPNFRFGIQMPNQIEPLYGNKWALNGAWGGYGALNLESFRIGIAGAYEAGTHSRNCIARFLFSKILIDDQEHQVRVHRVIALDDGVDVLAVGQQLMCLRLKKCDVHRNRSRWGSPARQKSSPCPRPSSRTPSASSRSAAACTASVFPVRPAAGA